MFSIDDTSGTMTTSGKTIKVDLSDYTKVGHGHQIIDVQGLETTLANKATAEHTHKIDDVSKLRDTLDKKSDKGHTHDVNTISNISKLSLLEDVNVLMLSLSKNNESKDYTCVVDEQGNLNVFRDEGSESSGTSSPLRIAQYMPSTNDWVFGSYSLKEIDTTLENHYQVLQKIIQVLKDSGLINQSINQQQ